MKNLILGVCLLASSAIFAQNSTTKIRQERKVPVKMISPQLSVQKALCGVVHKEQGKYVIQCHRDGRSQKMYPVNLDRGMMTEGQRIRFEYVVSDQKAPLSTIDEVVVLREVGVPIK